MEKKIKLPVLPLFDMVGLQGVIMPVVVSRKRSIRALERAMIASNRICLLKQLDYNTHNPKISDLHNIGIVGQIIQVIQLPDDTVRASIEGLFRVHVERFYNSVGFISADIKRFPQHVEADSKKLHTLIEKLKEVFSIYTKAVGYNKSLKSILAIEDPVKLFNIIFSYVNLHPDLRQRFLMVQNLSSQIEDLILYLEKEMDSMLSRSHGKSMDIRFVLDPSMVAPNSENTQEVNDDVKSLRTKINKAQMPKYALEKANKELKRLNSMQPMSSEAVVIRSYLECLTELPWNTYSTLNEDLFHAQSIMQKHHYGLDKIKDRILEGIAVTIRNKKAKSPILCLIGPPGVGKTSLASVIAEAIGRKFSKVSLGGLYDEAEIKGHRRTYIGSHPGRIIQAINKAKTSNPVILLDEIDKMGANRSDPAAALLEILDCSQNHIFSDHYLEVEYDLSKVMFIATANSLDIPAPLLDRLELVRLPGYTEEEKLEIAKRHLLPKQLLEHGIKQSELSLPSTLLKTIILKYTREAGVRNLEREIAKVCRKAVRELLENKKLKKLTINTQKLKKYLGIPKYEHNVIDEVSRLGVTNGLAYMEIGGDILPIEVVLSFGKGDLKMTGTLGEVMRESAEVAMSYVKSKAESYGISKELLKDMDVHIHVPEGAVPKDGPSAGIALAVSIVSAFTGIPVKKDIAMTGEISLRGKVMQIGGLKEKLLGARNGRVKTVLIPVSNKKDLEEISNIIKGKLSIVPVSELSEVLKLSLTRQLRPISWLKVSNEKFKELA